jgi:hypothetical protein
MAIFPNERRMSRSSSLPLNCLLRSFDPFGMSRYLTRLPNKPESDSAAALATQRSRPTPDKGSKRTSGPNLILGRLCWVPTETCSLRTGPRRSRACRFVPRRKTRMLPHRPHTPVTQSYSLRRKRDTDQLWAPDSLIVTLTQSSASNS